MYGNQSQITLIGCVLNANTATGNGGGFYATVSTVSMTNCTITGNAAINGGGVYCTNGTASVISSFVSSNAATHGGGLASVGALSATSLSVNNCTISSNTASGTSATGSQVYNSRLSTSATAFIANSTIVSDMSGPSYTGGAVYNDNGASLTIGNSILYATAQEHTLINAGAGTISSANYNLAFDNAGGFLTSSADQVNTDPLLDLTDGAQNNGGATFSIALQSGSPAIDHGRRDTIAALAASTDQRGEPRPYDDPGVTNAAGGDGSDIGAYEADLRMLSITRASSVTTLSFSTVLGRTYQLQDSTNLAPNGWMNTGGLIAGTGGIVSTQNTSSPPHFYKVQQAP